MPEPDEESEELLLDEPLLEELPPSEPDEDEDESDELDSDLAPESDLAAPSELAAPSDPFFAAPGATLPLRLSVR